MRTGRQTRIWSLVSLLEAVCAGCFMAAMAVGSPFSPTTKPMLWLAVAAILAAAYLGPALWATHTLLARATRRDGQPHPLLSVSTLPFLVGFPAGLALLLLKPDIPGWTWFLISSIQPFPMLAMVLALLLTFLLKTLAVALALPVQDVSRSRALSQAADVAIPAAMLTMGALQATVYLGPIGNAFLRFWAIADAIPAAVGYPVTLTESGPISAGSPPYVYDLPLFPLMLLAAFETLGHNSAAAHLPAALWNLLFPLSVYLLIKEATGSRGAALLFGTLVSLFPYLRFWVLNLPDPDPFLLTSLCLAAYFYLRALARPERPWGWAAAGLACGVLGLSRPEGLLYAAFLALGLAAHRPRIKHLVLFALVMLLFVAPMVGVWMANFGFLWPQNYNRTLRLDYPLQNYDILESTEALAFYWRGLGLTAETALALLLLFLLSVALGTLLMALKSPRLLAIAVPGIGNTVAIFFAHPHIPNTYHFADFFRHASFGIPFLAVTAAYGLHQAYLYLAGNRGSESRGWLRPIAWAGLLLVVALVVREGDILANPTASHRPGNPVPTQVLTTYTHLSLQAILEHPMPLPSMSYRHDGSVLVAYPSGVTWPEDALAFYEPLDMAFDSRARAFEYASVLAFLLGLGFAALASHRPAKGDPSN